MLTSNLKEVAARLEEYQRGLPGCVDRALAREYWIPWLRQRAAAALQHQFTLIADPATRERYQQRLPALLESIGALIRPGLAQFTFGIMPETVTDVNLTAAGKYASLSWTPTGRARKSAMPNEQEGQNLAASRQAVLDWVMMEKNLKTGPGERDEGLSMEEIANNVEIVLGLRPAMHERSDTMDAKAEELQGAIEAWLRGDPVTPGGTDIKTQAPDPTRDLPGRKGGVSSELVRQWLSAVLQTWLVNFRRALRDRIEAELKQLHRKVQAKQPKLL